MKKFFRRNGKKVLSVVAAVVLLGGSLVAGVFARYLLDQNSFDDSLSEMSGLSKDVDNVQQLYLSDKDGEANREANQILENENVDGETKAQVYTLQGNDAYASGDFLSAIELYEQAVALSPSSDVYKLIAGCWAELGEVDKAVSAYQMALQYVDPESPIAEDEKNYIQTKIELLGSGE